MQKVIQHCFILLLFCQNFIFADIHFNSIHNAKKVLKKSAKTLPSIVSSLVSIQLEAFPGAFNPSIFKTEEGFILTFRYLPEPVKEPWISFIGAVLLNETFEQISEPQLLNVRLNHHQALSQAEDARIFEHNKRIYVIYNDNPDVTNTSIADRRDIYMAELFYSNQVFSLSIPIKLYHPKNYAAQLWEKNWSPFSWNNTLFLSYFLNPHEVLQANLESGCCEPVFSSNTSVSWKWGQLRGGTPAILVDGEYLAFFHSSKEMVSQGTKRKAMWHYFTGAYTYSPNPPFNLTKVSKRPIEEKSFYVKSPHPKRVIYPGGFVISENNIYLAFGKNDCEIWIATIDKNKLMNSLRAVGKNTHE